MMNDPWVDQDHQAMFILRLWMAGDVHYRDPDQLADLRGSQPDAMIE